MKYLHEFTLFFLGVTCTYLLIDYKNTCWIKNDAKKIIDEKIKILVRQAARWSTAADQDRSALIKLLHANYGTGYLWALKDIANSDTIQQVANINMAHFEKEILMTQDRATKYVIQLCPEFAPPLTYLSKIGGEG